MANVVLLITNSRTIRFDSLSWALLLIYFKAWKHCTWLCSQTLTQLGSWLWKVNKCRCRALESLKHSKPKIANILWPFFRTTFLDNVWFCIVQMEITLYKWDVIGFTDVATKVLSIIWKKEPPRKFYKREVVIEMGFWPNDNLTNFCKWQHVYSLSHHAHILFRFACVLCGLSCTRWWLD
jgi:hypothetical protein